VKPYALFVIVPAKQIGWMIKHRKKLIISINGYGDVVCPKTEEIVIFKNGNLRK